MPDTRRAKCLPQQQGGRIRLLLLRNGYRIGPEYFPRFGVPGLVADVRRFLRHLLQLTTGQWYAGVYLVNSENGVTRISTLSCNVSNNCPTISSISLGTSKSPWFPGSINNSPPESCRTAERHQSNINFIGMSLLPILTHCFSFLK